MADVVAVGAHPDDVEIGMGAAVALMRSQGLEVVVCDLTNGEPTPHGTPETRAAEAAEAARILDVPRVTLTLPNRELTDTLEARRMLAEVFRRLRPRWVFAPYPVDAHPDHIAAAAICTAARFAAKYTKTDMAGDPFYPPKLYNYLAVHMRLLAKPSFVLDVTGHMPAKEAAISAYRSQFEASGRLGDMLESTRLQAAMWGSFVGAKAGEPFFSAEEIGVSDIRHLL